VPVLLEVKSIEGIEGFAVGGIEIQGLMVKQNRLAWLLEHLLKDLRHLEIELSASQAILSKARHFAVDVDQLRPVLR